MLRKVLTTRQSKPSIACLDVLWRSFILSTHCASQPLQREIGSQKNAAISFKRYLSATILSDTSETLNRSSNSTQKPRRQVRAFEHLFDIFSADSDRYLEEQEWSSFLSDYISRFPTYDNRWGAVVMKACETVGHVRRGQSLLRYVENNKVVSTVPILCSYILLLCKSTECDNERTIVEIVKKVQEITNVLDNDSRLAVIKGLCVTEEWKKALDFLDAPEVQQQRANDYSPVIRAACRHGDCDSILVLLNKMSGFDLVPSEEVVEEITKLNQTNKSLQVVQELLNLYGQKGWIFSQRSVQCLKDWFEKSQKWHGSFTRITPRGHCSACHTSLEKLEISEDTFVLLKEDFLKKSILGSDIFIKTKPSELRRFVSFLDKQGPFDIVFDALNIAYKGRGKPNKAKMSHQVWNVVNDFANRRRMKVLVVGRKHVRSWPDLKEIQSVASVFLTDDISKDDPFAIYAALFSGRECQLISSDQMRDHCFLLKKDLQPVFKLWQMKNQLIFLSWNTHRGCTFKQPLCYKPIVQRSTDNSWHIPFDNGLLRASYEPTTTWLCLRNT